MGGGQRATGFHREAQREPSQGENSTYQLRRELQVLFHIPAASFFLSPAKSVIPQTFRSLHKPICKKNQGSKWICRVTES